MIQFSFKIDNEYKFLSNFYWSPFVVSVPTDEGQKSFTFNTVEGFYQLHKHPEPLPYEVVKRFAEAQGDEARHLGRKLPIVIDWFSKREKIMGFALRMKFTQNTGMFDKLLATDDDYILHVSPWDLYWGGTVDGKGQNRLGKMLMGLRDG